MAHRVCLDAIFEAFAQTRDQKWWKDCFLWLYRGAWHEWPIDEIEMAVPISPDELMRKRKAIFMHQSQKITLCFLAMTQENFGKELKIEQNNSTPI